MATLANFNAGLFGKLRCAPVQCDGALGQCAKGIQSCHGLRQFGEGLNVGLQLVEQNFVKVFFAGQSTLLRRQGFVFKGFELRRDKTLGIFQSLTAAVVVWYFVDLTLRDFNVEAVHPVELNFQIGNASPRFFTRFQLKQEVVAIGLNGTQFVQF